METKQNGQLSNEDLRRFVEAVGLDPDISVSPHRAEPKKPTTQRVIGPEKLAVRLFVQTFAEAVRRSGRLQEVLDDYLQQVLACKFASKSDKAYAQKTYVDFMKPQADFPKPDKASSTEPAKTTIDALTAKDIADVCADIPTVSQAAQDTGLVSPDDVYLAGLQPEGPDPLTGAGGPLKGFMVEFRHTNAHPFVRPFMIDGVDFDVVGTFEGKVWKNSTVAPTGTSLRVDFAIAPWKLHREIPDTILVRQNGQIVQLLDVDELGNRRRLFVVRHRPGLIIRFWTRVGGVDKNALKKFVLLTPDGCKEIAGD